MIPKKKLIAFLVISILGISFTFYGYQILFTPNFLLESQGGRILEIKEGDSFKTVQKKLYDGRIINDLVSFSFIAKLSGYSEHPVSGRYLIKPKMSNLEVLKMLRAGHKNPVKVTFNTARQLDDLSQKITKNLAITPAEFRIAALDFAAKDPDFDENTIIAMFIPNTYEFYNNISPEDLITKLHREYQKFWNESRLEKAKKLNLSPIEVSTLASIVQAESVRSDEAPVIAGLYLNRLKEGMPLQADPTLVFASGDFSLKRVLNQHKETDSPYNTYKYKGLPPGPINLTEIRSIDAVLNYKSSDYLYMCASEDFSGRHNFTSDYNIHIANARKYQKALDREMEKSKGAN